MIHTRRLWALSALLVTLVLGACSTPDDLNAPTLEPQFGTSDEDRGIDVASVSTGRIYSLSEQSGPIYEYYDDGSSYQIGNYSKVFLRRQDSSGNVTWGKEIESAQCRDNYDQYYECHNIKAISVVADAQGNVNVLTASDYSASDGYDYYYSFVRYAIKKYNASGNYLSEVSIHENDISNLNPISFAVDGSGNYYVARTEGYAGTNVVAKYSASGSLLWQRTSGVGTPSASAITVSSTGSVYVVGSAGFARYTGSGNLSWKKTGNFEQVMISGSNIYTRYRKDIRKYDGTGKQLWYKAQSGLKTLVIQDMVGDGSGNIYLSGKYEVSGADWNAMTRKLNASGSVLWTKTYGTSGFYDDAKGIATINGSEIYTTGLTKGSLAHTNIGGEDGYLRKQNSSGNPLWMR
jgi:hypothetical protein